MLAMYNNYSLVGSKRGKQNTRFKLNINKTTSNKKFFSFFKNAFITAYSKPFNLGMADITVKKIVKYLTIIFCYANKKMVKILNITGNGDTDVFFKLYEI